MAAPQLYRRALPAGARVSAWDAPDGWTLRRFDWPGDRARARGSILFLPGRGDMIEKYLELFAHWHAQGWHVGAFDWRGQGGSGRLTADPLVGDIDDFATWIGDLAGFWRAWVASVPGPHVVVGHSMGGHLALRAAVEEAAVPDALVLVAPMLGLRVKWGNRLGELLARMLGGRGILTRPAWKGNGVLPGTRKGRQALLTHSDERYADEMWWRTTRPDLAIGPPSWRWVIQAFASTRPLREDPRLKQLACPVLMLVADADLLVSTPAALAVARRLSDARVVRFGSESAHEILREADPVRSRAIGEIDRFLANRVSRA